jgi:prolycopene isomerase
MMASELREPGRDSYDVVVVGAGLGGLTPAALLARAGLRVLAIERGDGPGGCAHAFQRGPYRFDPAVHWTNQAGPGELYDVVLRFLGVEDLCSFVRVTSGYDAVFPGTKLHAPAGLEAFVEAHVRAFPHEEEGIRRFFGLCVQMQHDIHQVSMSVALKDLDAEAARLPVLFRYRTSTVQPVLDECLSDPHAKAACTAIWPYGGSTASRLSFLVFAQTLYQTVESAWFCRGSFQRLADAFAAALERHGGELIVGTEVSRILVENGRAAGVLLPGGRRIAAPVVISNADALHTFEELVGAEHLPAAFLRKLRRMEPSLSAFVVFAATRLDLSGAAHETFLNRTWDHEETWRDIQAGKPGGVWLNVPTPLDPSLAPPGEHLVILSSLAAYDIGRPWAEEKERFTEELLAWAESVFPGLREEMTFVESATPETLARFTRNHRGACYGWEQTVAQSGTKRLNHRSPLDGLYVSGHWSLPGPGSVRVFTSGIHTAQIVLADAGRQDALADFSKADLPRIV